MLTVLHGLAGQLAANGLKSGKELEPAGTNGPLPCMLHTHMLPEKEKLVVEREACNRRLRDADEHALFKCRAAVGQWGAPHQQADPQQRGQVWLQACAQCAIPDHDA